MKITILSKRVSTNVLAQSANEALALLLEDDDAVLATINSAQVARVTTPGAAAQTIKFVEQSGVHILGYNDELKYLIADNPDSVQVWAVVVDLEFNVEFTPMAEPKNEIAMDLETAGQGVGMSSREVTDPNDRLDLHIPADPAA